VRRRLKKRYGRSSSSVRIYMGSSKPTEVVKKLSDGWHYRLWSSEPWVGPFGSKGYALERRDLALRSKRGGSWG
jgi:hypothetical protein